MNSFLLVRHFWNNITIQNNDIFRVQNSCYLRGTTAGADTGWVVSENTFGSSVTADKNIFRGTLLGNCVSFAIRDNLINGVVSTATSTAKMTGIQTALVINGGTIERNIIRDIKQINTGTFGAAGIDLTGGNNILVRNNFVSDILPGIESRSGGVGDIYQIVFTFASPVIYTGVNFTGTGMVSGSSGNGTNTITVDLSGVTTSQTITVTLTCVSDGVNMGDVPTSMQVLVGDVNADGVVDSSDVALTKSQLGLPVDEMNFRADLNASDSITSADVALVKANIS